LKYKAKNILTKCVISVFVLYIPINVLAASVNEAFPLPHTYNVIKTNVAVMLQNEFMSDSSLLVVFALGFFGLGYSLTKIRQA
jgi:hypothetical protein